MAPLRSRLAYFVMIPIDPSTYWGVPGKLRMNKLIRLAASICLAVALAACAHTPSTSDLDNADYGPRPTVGQIQEGIRALGGEMPGTASGPGGSDAGYRLSTGWATDLDNPGSYIYGWQIRFQQDAKNGGGAITALFHDGVLVAATRDTAGQAKPTRIK